jgi:hypothetical protein
VLPQRLANRCVERKSLMNLYCGIDWSQQIHGDPTPYSGLQRLSGAPTDSLALAVADAETVMRRAIYLVCTST